MEHTSTVQLFLDHAADPIGQFRSPVSFELDTRALSDGRHVLTIVSQDAAGVESRREIAFVVRNGPAIDVEGLDDGATVDGVVPLLVNAYGKPDARGFNPHGSETPRGVPGWVIALLIVIIGWGAHYLITNASAPPPGT